MTNKKPKSKKSALSKFLNTTDKVPRWMRIMHIFSFILLIISNIRLIKEDFELIDDLDHVISAYDYNTKMLITIVESLNDCSQSNGQIKTVSVENSNITIRCTHDTDEPLNQTIDIDSVSIAVPEKQLEGWYVEA
jgi:hypothetical protein